MRRGWRGLVEASSQDQQTDPLSIFPPLPTPPHHTHPHPTSTNSSTSSPSSSPSSPSHQPISPDPYTCTLNWSHQNKTSAYPFSSSPFLFRHHMHSPLVTIDSQILSSDVSFPASWSSYSVVSSHYQANHLPSLLRLWGGLIAVLSLPD